MKKFHFSLEKILQFKNQTLDNLKFDLANLQHLLKIKNDEIENLRIKYMETDSLYNDKIKLAIQPYEIEYYKNFLNKLINDIKKKIEEEKIVIKKIEHKKEEIINMNKEISTLDKLKEKKVDEYNKILLKSEEAFIDEFVNNSNMITVHNI